MVSPRNQTKIEGAMNKMKQGYQIPVRRIYRLSDTNKGASEKDLNSARSGYSANNVLTKNP
jgi:hypothetical protein